MRIVRARSVVPISLTLAASSLLATLAVRAQQARSLALFALKASILFRYPLFYIGDEGMNNYIYVF